MGAERGSVSGSRRALRRFVSAVTLLVLLASALPSPARGQSGDAPAVDVGGKARNPDPTLVDDRAPLPAGVVVEQASVAPSTLPLPEVDLQSRIKDIRIKTTTQGQVVRVRTDDGYVDLTPTEFVGAIAATESRVENGGFFYRIFNISKPWGFVWITVGLLGQVMFTFRMVLQWLASEKHKRSIVPVGFWWGSLIGGAMLFAYFCWRKDVVGIIGQSSGVFIYARNLVLIYRGKRIESEGARPVDEGGDGNVDEHRHDEHVQKSGAATHAT